MSLRTLFLLTKTRSLQRSQAHTLRHTQKGRSSLTPFKLLVFGFELPFPKRWLAVIEDLLDVLQELVSPVVVL